MLHSIKILEANKSAKLRKKTENVDSFTMELYAVDDANRKKNAM